MIYDLDSKWNKGSERLKISYECNKLANLTAMMSVTQSLWSEQDKHSLIMVTDVPPKQSKYKNTFKYHR